MRCFAVALAVAFASSANAEYVRCRALSDSPYLSDISITRSNDSLTLTDGHVRYRADPVHELVAGNVYTFRGDAVLFTYDDFQSSELSKIAILAHGAHNEPLEYDCEGLNP